MTSARDPCRILLCEDSATYAEGLTRFLEQDPELRVVARSSTGEEAADELARVAPDLVIMDIALPGIDGVEATARLMAARPVPVLVLSSRTRHGSQLALAALGAGALDVRSKSEVTIQDPAGARAVAFRRYLKRLAASPRIARPDTDGAAAPSPAEGRSAAMIGLAASTGGPPAVQTVLAGLPADFPIPIVVAQQIAHGFLDGLVQWLDAEVALPVRLATDRAPLGPGAWIAPDDAHLLVDEGFVARLDAEAVAEYRPPAADLLFVSLASAVGPEAVAVVLTGMGSDGADGIEAVIGSGGLTIAQDEFSSVAYGMPKAAAEAGAEQILPLEEIAPVLTRLSPAKRL